MERAGGVRYTIKDGIIYDAPGLLRDVREIVAQDKQDKITGSPSPVLIIKTCVFYHVHR